MNTQASAQIKSPCVRRCTLNPQDVCIGCGRSLTEIQQWSVVGQEQQSTILQNSQARLNALAVRQLR